MSILKNKMIIDANLSIKVFLIIHYECVGYKEINRVSSRNN